MGSTNNLRPTGKLPAASGEPCLASAPMLSQDELEQLRGEAFADDVPIKPEMAKWQRADVVAYFESGGESGPAGVLAAPTVSPPHLGCEKDMFSVASSWELLSCNSEPTEPTAT